MDWECASPAAEQGRAIAVREHGLPSRMCAAVRFQPSKACIWVVLQHVSILYVMICALKRIWVNLLTSDGGWQ